MTPANSPRQIGTRWFSDVWNKRNFAAASELMASDAKGHLEGGLDIFGPEQFLAFQKSILAALPDIQIQVVDTLADGDDVCIRWLATAVHSGDGLGFSATGKNVSFQGMTWLKVRNGKIIEGWDAWNQGKLFESLRAKA